MALPDTSVKYFDSTLYDDFSDSAATNLKWSTVGETETTPEFKLLLKNDLSVNSNSRVISTEYVGSDTDQITEIRFKWSPGERTADIQAVPYVALVYQGISRTTPFEVPASPVPIILLGQPSDSSSRTKISMGLVGTDGITLSSGVSVSQNISADSEISVQWIIDWNLKKSSVFFNDSAIMVDVPLDYSRTQPMSLEFGNPGVGATEELFDDVYFNSFFTERYKGIAKKLDGSSADLVVIRNFVTHDHVVSIIPDEDGKWAHVLDVGKYDITFYSEKCAPICHGPYTVQRQITSPPYSSLGGTRVFLLKMDSTLPNWYSDYYQNIITLNGSTSQSTTFFKTGTASAKFSTTTDYFTSQPITLNQDDFVFEGFVRFESTSAAYSGAPYIWIADCNQVGTSPLYGLKGFTFYIQLNTTTYDFDFNIRSGNDIQTAQSFERYSGEIVDYWTYFAIQRVQGQIRLFIKNENTPEGAWSQPINGNSPDQDWSVVPGAFRFGNIPVASSFTSNTYLDSVRLTRGAHYGTLENPWPTDIDGSDLINFV